MRHDANVVGPARRARREEPRHQQCRITQRYIAQIVILRKSCTGQGAPQCHDPPETDSHGILLSDQTTAPYHTIWVGKVHNTTHWQQVWKQSAPDPVNPAAADALDQKNIETVPNISDLAIKVYGIPASDVQEVSIANRPPRKGDEQPQLLDSLPEQHHDIGALLLQRA